MLYPRYKHSPSSGNLWLESGSHFLWKYGLQNWGADKKPRIDMGKAAERAVYEALEGKKSADWANSFALETFDKMQSGEVCEEREHVGGIAANMVKMLSEFGEPIKVDGEKKKIVRVDGLSKEITYEPDLLFARGLVDLKATLKLPSEPRWSHVRQVGLYSRFEGIPAFLAYATGKRSAVYPVSQGDAGLGFDELAQAFRQIERWDTQFPTPQDAIRFMPLDLTSFYWSDEEDALKARRVWSECETD